MRITLLILWAAAVVFWGCERSKTITGATASGQVVSFPDTALEDAVRSALQEPSEPITVGDLEGITRFNGNSW